MKSLITFTIKGYQKIGQQFWYFGIPIFAPSNCKYYPSCSQYAINALEKFGTIKGINKTIWRILRCNPWSKGGLDEV